MAGTEVSSPSPAPDSPLGKLAAAKKTTIVARPTMKAGGKLGAVVAGASLLSDWIIANAPDAWEYVKDYFGRSGMSEDDINKMPRGYILERLAKFGVNPAQLAELGLSGEEMRVYAQLFSDYAHQNSAIHDRAQFSRGSTGDAVVDRDLMNMGIARAAALLGLQGKQRARALYDLAMILNSITEDDVEAFERHEMMYGTIRTGR